MENRSKIKYLIVFFILFSILVAVIYFKKGKNSLCSEFKSGNDNIKLFFVLSSKIYNSKCKICAKCEERKNSSYIQWKKLYNIFRNKNDIVIKLICLESKKISKKYLKSFKEIIKKVSSRRFEYLRDIKNSTLICRQGKVLYFKEGSLDIKSYRNVIKILEGFLSDKSKHIQ